MWILCIVACFKKGMTVAAIYRATTTSHGLNRDFSNQGTTRLCPCALYDTSVCAMPKNSPNPPHSLTNPEWLHGIDQFIERVNRIVDAHMKRRPRRRIDHKALPKSA